MNDDVFSYLLFTMPIGLPVASFILYRMLKNDDSENFYRLLRNSLIGNVVLTIPFLFKPMYLGALLFVLIWPTMGWSIYLTPCLIFMIYLNWNNVAEPIRDFFRSLKI